MKSSRTPNNRLESAIAHLIEAQSLSQIQIAKAHERMAQTDERLARSDERAARLDERLVRLEERLVRLDQESTARFAAVERTLEAIVQTIQQLPDAVKEKMGFATVRP